MGTEKFIAFKEDGTAYRLKGRILRFLDNEPVSEADKTNIRSTLSVPASAEGLTPANNLSDLDNAATARANLSVNSIDEDAEATATKLVGPALYFDGVNDYVEIADDAKLSFTDGTDDLPFSISAWVKSDDWTSKQIICKDDSSTQREWILQTTASDELNLRLLKSDGTAYEGVNSTTTLTSLQGVWIHICATYGGSGPNSASAFTAAADEITLYINGQAAGGSEDSASTYTGQTDGTQAVRIGLRGSNYFKGHIKDVKIFNRELTAAEVAQLARGVDLGFADEWGGAVGGAYASDFSAGSDSWTATRGTVLGNIDAIGGKDDNLRLTVDASNNSHFLKSGSILTPGKRYRITADFYIPSTNSNVDGLSFFCGTSFPTTISENPSPTLDAWVSVSGEFTALATVGADSVVINVSDGGNLTINDTGGDDVVYLRNVKVTEIGILADLRAENYDESTGKLYDESSNAFVGVNSGATLTGRALPVYQTGTWVPSLYYSGTSAATYSAQSGYYTRIGNTVYVRGSITVSGIGASSGAVSVVGLPFTPSSDGASSSVAECYMTSAANLTSQPIGLVGDGVSQISLYDSGATGNTALDETNITASSVIKISATYQIQ